MRRALLATVLSLALALLAAACGGGAPAEVALPLGHYDRFTVKDPQQSAGFLAVEDLDGDGVKEIVLSTLIEQSPPGPPTSASRGALRVFRSAGGVEGPWNEQAIIATDDPDGYPFINTPQVFDVDGDGVKDLLVHTGFLTTLGGAQFWIRGPGFTQRSNFAPQTTKGMTGYFWHQSAQVDLDGDGLQDIVTTSAQTQDLQSNPGNPTGKADGHEKLKVEWHRNLGNGAFEYHEIATGMGGVFITVHDVDADGDPDIVLSQFFGPPAVPSLLWLENLERPSAANGWAGRWQPHTIDATIGLGYFMQWADMDGDGREDLVACSHNNQNDTRLRDADGAQILPGLYWFQAPRQPRGRTPWIKHVISQEFRVTLNDMGNPASQGVPGIFSVGDIDGDGRLDVAVPGDGNDKLYAFLQRADGSFAGELIEQGEKMFGMVVIADLDGDGRNEIVAAKHNSNDGGTTLPPGFVRIYRYHPG